MPSFRKCLGIELSEVSLTEKLVATLGGGLAILTLALVTRWALPAAGLGATALVASMGASAVLLFAVPHGQLSQPWPVLAGHGLSAAIGVACAYFIPHPLVAAACAVGLSIGAMHQFKCIHPPGGATAFTAVLGGPAVLAAGPWFILFPVLTNAAVMVILAVAINSLFRWRRYPAVLSRPRAGLTLSARQTPPPTHEEVVAAVRSLDSFVDISEEDLIRLTALLTAPKPEPRPLAVPARPALDRPHLRASPGKKRRWRGRASSAAT